MTARAAEVAGRQPTGVGVTGPPRSRRERLCRLVENHCGRARRSRHIDDGSAAAACPGGRARRSCFSAPARHRRFRSDRGLQPPSSSTIRPTRRLRPGRRAARVGAATTRSRRSADQIASRLRHASAFGSHRWLSRPDPHAVDGRPQRAARGVWPQGESRAMTEHMLEAYGWTSRRGRSPTATQRTFPEGQE